jgi:protein-disulfide isomerase
MMKLLLALLFAGTLSFPVILPPRAMAEETTPPAQVEAVERIIHEYLLSHPDELIEVLRSALEKEKQQSGARAHDALVARRSELFEDPTAPVGGNPKGDVTIVEFFDYRCPYCKQVEPSIEALLREDERLRIVYKEWPILGKDSVYASHVALAAQTQGKYDAFHTAMMAIQGQIDEEVVLKVANSVGLDVAKIKADMNKPEIEDVLTRNKNLAEALGIHGTPAWVIGDEMIAGALDIATMKAKIAAVRKSG